MTEENYDFEIPPGFANEMGQVVGRISGCGSRKRPTPHSFDLTHFQHQASSQKQKSSVGVQDRLASLKPSMNQSDAAIKVKGYPISTVAKSQSGQTNRPQSILIKEVKTEVEDVAPDIIHRGTTEEGQRTNGARCDHKTNKFSDIDFSFLQQVANAFEEVKANQEKSTKFAKESISVSPSLEPTFLSIVKKHGDISSDCPLESSYMLTSVLEAICKVVQELQKKRLADFDCDLLNSYCSVVRDAERMKVNVKWLKTRLDEIKDAVNCIVKTKKLSNEKNRLEEQIKDDKKDLQSMKDALEKLKSEIVKRENLLELDTLLAEDISSLINDQALRIRQFQKMPLMEAFQ